MTMSPMFSSALSRLALAARRVTEMAGVSSMKILAEEMKQKLRF